MTIQAFEEKIPIIKKSTFIATTALIIGDVELGEDVSIWPMCVLRGDINKITIGRRSNIQDGTIIHVNHASEFNPKGDPVIVGEEVIVGHQAVLHGCTIKNNVLIGIGAKVLDGVYIEPEVMVGAGSLVPPKKILESGYLYFGSPVEKIRSLTEEEKTFLRYSADYYVKLKDRYLYEFSKGL